MDTKMIEIQVPNENIKLEDCQNQSRLEILDEDDNMIRTQTREYRCSEKTSYFKERHSRHRTSLHGKALNFRASRNDARYRRLQAKIYNFLERPKTYPSIIYHVLIFASVFMCLMLSVLSTIAKYDHIAGEALLYTELIMLFWFFTEYCLRMWSAGCRSRYQSWRGRLQFAKRPFCLVDVVVILASIVVLVIGSDRQKIAASAFRGLRFFQILRMIRMDRRGGSWKLLASVVWAHRQELFTTVYIGFLGLIFSSFLIYLVEKDKNQKIKTYADALWWGVITLCTVGYGDIVPETWIGKIIAAFCAVAGISFFALPAGILGSGFALKVQQHQRQKHLIRRRVPAATLIQSLWRCYAADPSSTSCATWKIHMRPMRSPPNSDRLTRFGRFSSTKRKKDKGSLMQSHPSNSSLYRRNAIESTTSNQAAPTPIENELPMSNDVYNEEFLENSINSSRSMKKRFRALAQSMKCHMNMNAPSVETSRKFSSVMVTLDKENGSDEIHFVTHLTEVDRNVIRAVRKIKFFVARKKFREALRPYDVKDVMEQYSAGHVDMLARIKNLQSRLDLIVGQQSNKDNQGFETKISLTTRIINVEKQVDSIESKLDLLINMYTEDRNKIKENPSFHNLHSCLTDDNEYHVSSPWIALKNNNNNTNNTQADNFGFLDHDEFPKPMSILRCKPDCSFPQSFQDEQSKSNITNTITRGPTCKSNISENCKEKIRLCKTQFFIESENETENENVKTKEIYYDCNNDGSSQSDIQKKNVLVEEKVTMTSIHKTEKRGKGRPSKSSLSDMEMSTNHEKYDYTKNSKTLTSFIGPFSESDAWLSEIDDVSECIECNSPISIQPAGLVTLVDPSFNKDYSILNAVPDSSIQSTQEMSVAYKMKPESQPLLVGSHVKQMKKSFC